MFLPSGQLQGGLDDRAHILVHHQLDPTWVHTAGAWCLAAGLVGVAQAALVLAWPKQVSVDRFSYPFASAAFEFAQATFALQHVPLAIGVATLGSLPAVRASAPPGSGSSELSSAWLSWPYSR